MKSFLFLSLFFLCFSPFSFAQLGDFRLEDYSDSAQPRTFAVAAANPEMKSGPLKNLVIGKNYRKEWRERVRVPVVNFATDLGGIKPKEEGGGRQTRSLEIEDGTGQKWVLRSVRKYPENVVIPALQGTIAEKIVADGISASYPYSVLSVGSLAKAAGVPFLPNTLVYIPDDPALGEFRDKYKNTLSLLERRTIFSGGEKQKTYNTEDVIPALLKSTKNRIDQRKVLKGRLLDNFIMDFDRHEGQWEWVKNDSAGKTFYYPIAKDRDQAFFRATGILPGIARFLQPTLGSLQGFRKKATNIKTFNFVPRDFDRTFLNELDEKAWSNEVDAFLSSLSDAVIEDAVNRQPAEARRFHGDKILKILKEKRESFKEDMMEYYRFLAHTVSVTGSNRHEQFTVTQNSDGTTHVQVHELDSLGNAQAIVYQRSFMPHVTRELRLYGLEGDDKFIMRGDEGSHTIRLIGGPGNDQFINEGEGGNILVYDVSFEDNTVQGQGMKSRISDDPMTNEYQRLGAPYTIKLPGIGLELTREGGLFLGLTYKVTKPGFRKEPYASMHSLYAAQALNSSSYHLRYNADFILSKKMALLLRSEALLPTVRTYFFGLGNNTQYNPQNNPVGDRFYYQASYRQVDGALLARYSPNNWLQFTAGPIAQYLKVEGDRNRGKYVSTVYPQDFGHEGLYNGRLFGGGEIRMQLNRRNHPVFTTQGIELNLYARSLYSLDKHDEAFDQLGGNVSFFTDVLWRRVIVLATSFGADRNYGKFLFPQAQYLGFRQNLRGYRFQRFAGRARAYNNTEIRINLGIRNFYFFKGPVGLLGFHDMGRVWINGEESDTLHRGYGGGIWVAPFTKVVIIGTVASSKEEKRWLQVSFGFQF